MRSVRLATALVRLYPRAWRVRYESELRALLQDHPPSAGELLDLIRGCGSEWTRLLSDPVAYPRLSLVPREPLLGTMQIATGLVFGLFVVGTGDLLRDWRQPPLTMGGLSVATFVLLASILRVLPVTKSRWTRYHVSVIEMWFWTVMLASSFVFDRWNGVGPLFFAPIDVIRAASGLWSLSTATKACARAMEIHRLLQAAQRDESGLRLRSGIAQRYLDAAPADVETRGCALAEVHDRIRQHAAELRRIPLLSLVGLRKL